MLIFVAAVHDRGVLGHDGDAALALQVVGVHDALGDLLVVAEDVALPEHGVDQRGLAVVDVRDDRDVADIVPAHCYEYGAAGPCADAQRAERYTVDRENCAKSQSNDEI